MSDPRIKVINPKDLWFTYPLRGKFTRTGDLSRTEVIQIMTDMDLRRDWIVAKITDKLGGAGVFHRRTL